MATDFFLKLDGIKGESKDHKHKDEIQLESFSWGATQSASFGAGGGGGAGKVSFQDFHFVMKINKASPTLLQNCASGKHIPTAVLTARKAGEKPMEYLKVKFSDVLVSSFQTGGNSGGEIPMEQVSLAFGAINVEYYEQDDKGQALPGAVIASWDIKKNVKA
jgi:type VI secretion system secreted protein Hcp